MFKLAFLHYAIGVGTMGDNSNSNKGQKGNNPDNMWIHSPERNFELGTGLTVEMANKAFPPSSHFGVGVGSEKPRGGSANARGRSPSSPVEGIVCDTYLRTLYLSNIEYRQLSV